MIQASVNGYSCKGIGPNKKIAKRNAATSLLAVLGYTNLNQQNANAKAAAAAKVNICKNDLMFTFNLLYAVHE